MERIIKTTTSTRRGMVGNKLAYVTYENEEIPELVLNLIRCQNNTYPFLALLYHEAKKADKILELGIGPGRSTMALLLGCKYGKGGHQWSIDWGRDGSTIQAIKSVKRMGLSKYFTWLQCDAATLSVNWYENNKMDLIWIDIDAANYPVILDRCTRSMHIGSKLFLHNIDVGRGEKEAIMPYAAKPEFSYEEISLGHGLGILTKTR